MQPWKEDLFRRCQGKLLELGAGPAPNLPYFLNISSWTGLEPNEGMRAHILPKLKNTTYPCDLVDGVAEHLPFDANSFDSVAATLLLCSVKNPATVLNEISRVLKPGGKFYFIEHVLSPDQAWLRTVQHTLSLPWRLVAENCHCDRVTSNEIEKGSFREVVFEEFYVPWTVFPFFLTPHICGVATK